MALGAAHPSSPAEQLAGGPQIAGVSRDGRQVHLNHSLYGGSMGDIHGTYGAQVLGADEIG